MQDMFRSYYRPTDVEFSTIWSEGIFSFDTNVLLDIYRYTPETRNRLFEILSRYNDRIWIPYHVAYEYHERRLDVISDQVKIAETIKENLSNSLEKMENDLRGYKNHPFANTDQLMKIIRVAVESYKTSLQKAKTEHPNFIRKDQLLETITALFNSKDKIGQPYSDIDLIKLYQEFDERYEKKIPPGYEDAKRKKDERKYGDVIIWYQLIDFAKTEKKPIIFVTGERKEDWWLRHKGETIGPRRELFREMHSKTGILFHMYSTDQFMERAEENLDLHDQKEAIEEVRDIIRQDEANTLRSSDQIKVSIDDLYEIENDDYLLYREKPEDRISEMWRPIVVILRQIAKILKIGETSVVLICRELSLKDIIDMVLYNDVKYLYKTAQEIIKYHEKIDEANFNTFIELSDSVLNRLHRVIQYTKELQ